MRRPACWTRATRALPLIVSHSTVYFRCLIKSLLSSEQTLETMLEEEHQSRLAFDESESNLVATFGDQEHEEKVCDISADLSADEA